MKKIIALIGAVLLFVIPVAGCGETKGEEYAETVVLEQGEEYLLEEDGVTCRVSDRNGNEVLLEDGVFKAEDTGDYLVKYNRGGKEINGIVKVYPTQAPVITLTENENNVLWRTGYTYYLPEARVQDNVDPAPVLDVKVYDEQKNEIDASDGKIFIQTKDSLYSTVVFTATDRVGNVSVKEMHIYTTGETEVSSFETLSLMSGWYASDNNRNDTSKYSLSYNTDAQTNLEGSSGNLRLDLLVREQENINEGSTAWPGIFIEGADLPVSDISEEKYKGISFDIMYMTEDGRPYQLNANVISTDKSQPDNIYANISRYIMDEEHGTAIEQGKWTTVFLTKELIAQNASIKDPSTGEGTFNFTELTRFYIWGQDIIQGTGGRTDFKVSLFIDNIKYMM